MLSTKMSKMENIPAKINIIVTALFSGLKGLIQLMNLSQKK
jgi:hypothetical protein